MMKYIILTLFLIVLLWMVTDVLMQPGIRDLKGEFKELAFVRNEQNTGPVVRIYAVSVKDTLWGEMQKYGNFMPHNKYGNTKVYFFLNNTPAPNQLLLENGHFGSEYKNYCIGVYEKNAMGQTTFSRFPFTN